MTKCPSSIWRQDSNPQPFEHKSSPITTRPGLLPIAVWYQTGRWKLRPGRWACAASLRLKLSSDQIITSMLYLSHRKKAMKKVKRLFVDDLENCCFYESVGKTKINKFIYKIFGNIFKDYLVFGLSFQLTLAQIVCFWTNLIAENCQILKTPSGHTEYNHCAIVLLLSVSQGEKHGPTSRPFSNSFGTFK